MDEMGLNASVVGQLQDLVIDSEDVSGFLEDLAVFTASSVSAARGQDETEVLGESFVDPEQLGLHRRLVFRSREIEWTPELAIP